MTITEFLLARIADDEAMAQAAVWVSDDPDWDGVDSWQVISQSGSMSLGPEQGAIAEVATVLGPFKGGLYMGGASTGGRRIAVAEHIARHNPARILAECKAKRAIMEIHKIQQVPEDSPLRSDDEWTCLFCDEDRWPQGVCGTIRAIASVYGDHPDYQREWAIDTRTSGA